MCCIAVANWTVDSTDTACANTNSGLLTNIFYDTASGSVNTVKAVIGFNKNTTAKLPLRCTNTSHNRCRQTNVMLTNCIIVFLNPVHTFFCWITMEQCCSNENIAHLWCFIYCFCYTVLHKILATHLFHSNIGKIFITLVTNKSIDAIPFFFSIPID